MVKLRTQGQGPGRPPGGLPPPPCSKDCPTLGRTFLPCGPCLPWVVLRPRGNDDPTCHCWVNMSLVMMTQHVTGASLLSSYSVVSDSATPWPEANLSFTICYSLLKLMSIDWMILLSNLLIFCYPLLFLPLIFPSNRVFSNESALCISWPKYWSFSFRISPSNGYSGLISIRIDRLDLLAVQGVLKSLLQHHSWTFVGKVMSVFFNGGAPLSLLHSSQRKLSPSHTYTGANSDIKLHPSPERQPAACRDGCRGQQHGARGPSTTATPHHWWHSAGDSTARSGEDYQQPHPPPRTEAGTGAQGQTRGNL